MKVDTMRSSADETRYHWTLRRSAPPPDEGDHVNGLQIQRIIYEASLDYVCAISGVDDPYALDNLPARPALRSVAAEFEAALVGETRLVVGVRTASRSRRSFVLEGLLEREDDGVVVARGRTSWVVIDPRVWRSTEIPDAMAARMELLDGAPGEECAPS